MASIASTLARFKSDPQRYLPDTLIDQALRDSDHRWRERLLGPVVTVQLMILQVMFGNISGRSVLRLANITASDTAYFAARARLPIDVLGRLLLAVTERADACCGGVNLWLGHRVFTLDGSGISMPDTPALQKAFGQPGRQLPGGLPGVGFPVMHTLWMFDHVTEAKKGISTFIPDRSSVGRGGGRWIRGRGGWRFAFARFRCRRVGRG